MSMVQLRTRDAKDSCADRQSPGYICPTCNDLAICVKRNNAWETIHVEECDTANGFFCNAQQGSCSNQTGTCLTFKCASVGIFPDPFDCHSYHVCYSAGNNFIGIGFDCSAGTAFNPLLADCSLRADHELCTKFRYTCKRPGDTAAWPMNANIFYVCITDINPVTGDRHLYPNMYRCQQNYVFDGNRCVDSEDGVPPEIDFQCTAPGLFPDEESCRNYFYCSYDLKSEKHTCPTGTYFSVPSSACTIGEC